MTTSPGTTRGTLSCRAVPLVGGNRPPSRLNDVKLRMRFSDTFQSLMVLSAQISILLSDIAIPFVDKHISDPVERLQNFTLLIFSSISKLFK